MKKLIQKAKKFSAVMLAAGVLCLPLAGCAAGTADKPAQEAKTEQAQSFKPAPKEIKGRNVGKTCRVHYKGTLNDGTQFDSSLDRGEPLEFVCGAGMMIKGFDAAVADMKVGEESYVHLMPDEAYGQPRPEAIFTIPIANLPGSENLKVDERVVLSNAAGQPIPVKVTAKDDTNITFDANHEMAGKELNFYIKLVEVK